MPLMNHTNLPSKWYSKYVHSTVLHSRILTGFDYLVGHNMPIITNTHKSRLQKMMYTKFFGVSYPHNNYTTNFNHT